MSEPLFDSYDKLANRTKAIMGDAVDFLDIESSQTQLGVPLSGRSTAADYDFGAVSELDQVSTYYIANQAVTSAKLASGAAVANIGYTPGTGTMSSFTLAGDSGTSSITNTNTLTVAGGTGLTSAVSGDTVTVNLDNTAATPAAYTAADITVDAQGRITAAASGSIATAEIANDAVGADQLANTAVTPGSYTATDLTVDAQGRITAASSGSIATAEIANDAVTADKLAHTAVTAGSYTLANITVDAQGRITAASNGSASYSYSADNKEDTGGTILATSINGGAGGWIIHGMGNTAIKGDGGVTEARVHSKYGTSSALYCINTISTTSKSYWNGSSWDTANSSNNDLIFIY